MKVGIMSDSHDSIKNIKKALSLFRSVGVEYVIHAGDLISPFCVELFSDFKDHFYICNGNNIGDTKLVKERVEKIGIFFDDVGEFIIGNKRFALYHGTNKIITDALLNSNNYDYVIVGHTHKKMLKKYNNTLLINPGETFGDLFGVATIAILDLTTNKVEFHKI